MTFGRRDTWSPLVINAVFTLALGTAKALSEDCHLVAQSGDICKRFAACRDTGEPDIGLCEIRTKAIITVGDECVWWGEAFWNTCLCS